jgi:O-antigen/teichoic acid export membrane protein
VNLLIVIVTIQTALLRSDSYLLDAALRPRERVMISAVAGICALGLGLALAPKLGMVGVCTGLLIGRAIQSIAYPVIVSGSLGASRRLPWESLARPAVASVLVLSAAMALGQRLLVQSWVLWAGLVTVSFALLVPVVLFTGLAEDDRQRLVARARGVISGVRDRSARHV